MVYNWYENPRFGRRNIYTAEREITSENIIQVLQDTFLLHQENVLMSQYLLDYDSGIQPILQRSKAVRPKICNKVIDNIASEITEFKLGFNWPTGISFVRRGEKDSGKGSELDGLTLLNECYEAENIKSKRQQMARYTERVTVISISRHLILALPTWSTPVTTSTGEQCLVLPTVSTPRPAMSSTQRSHPGDDTRL